MKVIFGGTFDPVHIGHLRMATELRDALSVDRIDLMPCAQPVHKHDVSASAQQRLDMLRLAICKDVGVDVDVRELQRNTPSYTYDSLRELRDELGDEPLCMVVGTDAAQNLASWYCADQLASLTHVVILRRPDELAHERVESLIEESMIALGFGRARSVDEVRAQPHGLYLGLALSQLDISSTQLRSDVRKGRSIRYLVTDAVNEFICDNELYKT
jgi:nicotinate-nucleotide adenylyltransferase